MSDEFTVDGIFQARVSSKRESKAGIFLTVEITADDYSPALAQLRAGSLLRMGWQELLNVGVEPIEVEIPAYDEKSARAEALRLARAAEAERIPKPKQKFADLPLSQQCAMRCEEEEFLNFFDTTYDRRLEDSLSDAVRRGCGVASRSEIKPGTQAAAIWLAIEAAYQNWLTDQKYSGTRR